jgi:hypothetical protein
MKKTTLSIALISTLSLALLGGITAAAADSGSTPPPRPPVAQQGGQGEKPGKPPQDPASRDGGQGEQQAINGRERPSEPGLAPPPRRGGSSREDRQERTLKEAAELGVITEGKKIEEIQQEIHTIHLESIADLLNSTAAEANISTEGLSLDEIQQQLRAYYFAKLETIGIRVGGGNGNNTGSGMPERPTPRSNNGEVPPANPNAPSNAPAATSTTSTTSNPANGTTVVISGGFDTDRVDNGRPVVLIAAALGVPTEVFREAFSGVTPAGAGGDGPTSELAQRNKAALLRVLAPYGITNERLDEVSNYYRYSASKGQVWSRTLATATATLTNGAITGVTVTNPGAGYSSNPTITVTGPNGTVTATATIAYTTDFRTNGSITGITIQ